MSHCLFLFVSLTLLAYSVISQDVVFPKVEEAPYLSGNNPVITERIPVYIPGRCPENMLLYPGQGDKSTWICDCKPGYLYFPYFPLNETCYEAYTTGPCGEGNYVWLSKGGVVPICVENPCGNVGCLPYNEKCYHLGSTDEEPCGKDTTICVNKKTFQIDCVKLPPTIKQPLSITAPKRTLNPCRYKGHKIKDTIKRLLKMEIL